MTQSVTYKNINSVVRTGRCAVLINGGSSHWRAAVQQIIAAASEVWGGRSFVIIPTDGRRINAKFWQLLEAYSPDNIGVYRLTVADLEESSPAEYAQIRLRYSEQWKSAGYDEAEFDGWFRESAESSQIDSLSIDDELNRQLLERLSPFSLTGNSIDQYISRRTGFGFPFTDMIKIIPFAAESIRSVVIPELPDNAEARLILASQAGLASPGYQDRLDSIQVATTTLAPNIDTIDFIIQLLGGRPSIGGSALDEQARTLFSLSMLHLGEYYEPRRHTPFKEPVIVVIGDDAQDFCLYYSLSRLHRGICWLPLGWLRDTSRFIRQNGAAYTSGIAVQPLAWEQRLTVRLVGLFYELIEHGTGEKRIQLCSTSLTLHQLSAYRRQLVECCMVQPDQFATMITCIDIGQIDIECTMRVFEEDNYTNNSSVIFVDGESVSPLATPKPKNFKTVLPSGHYWITSLQIEGYVPPTVPSLSQKILGASGLSLDSRVGIDGIAYHCPSMSYFGGGIDANLVRPHVTMPDEMSLLSSYFELGGVEVSYSDKGNYVLDTIARFGDLEKAGAFVRNLATRTILDMFVTNTSIGDGRAIYLANDQRTYLRFDAFADSLGNEVHAADLIDDLVERQVLDRGYILLCHRCRLSSWYGMDVVTNEFRCSRCGLRQPFSRSRWKMPVEASWYYKLAETIYQFYHHHSDVTVQALYKLKSMARASFLYTPEIELQHFPSAGSKRELDIACILDGKVVVGECKTEPLRSRDITKFRQMREKFYKPPGAVVFATNLAAVSDDFRSRADAIDGSMIWTFGDLYDS